MSVTYKITYEHRDGNEIRTGTVLLHSGHEPTQDEIHDAVRRDTVKFYSPTGRDVAIAGFSIIAVMPEP